MDDSLYTATGRLEAALLSDGTLRAATGRSTHERLALHCDRTVRGRSTLRRDTPRCDRTVRQLEVLCTRMVRFTLRCDRMLSTTDYLTPLYPTTRTLRTLHTATLDAVVCTALLRLWHRLLRLWSALRNRSRSTSFAEARQHSDRPHATTDN